MALASFSELSGDARGVLEEYLCDVDSALRPLDSDAAEATLEDVSTHALEALEPAATPDDVRTFVVRLGEPATYAASLRDAMAGGAPSVGADDSDPQGRILGMPYDLRLPTEGRVAARWWNPADPRVIMPKVFGMGWTVNFGAIAVRARLIEPDAEDVAFATTPDCALQAALLVPVGLAGVLLGSYLALRAHLPAALPTHWNAAGAADGYSGQTSAFAIVFALAALPSLAALVVVAMRRRRPTQAFAVAGAAFFAALAAAIWVLTLATVFGSSATGWLPLVLLVLVPFVVAFAVLVILARAGRAAEQRRDLERQGQPR